MRSFRHKPDPRHATFTKLAGSVETQLREAYAKRHDQGRINQAGLAKLLGIGRSVINRRFNGSQNLTLQSIADLVWGMGHAIDVTIYDPEERADRNTRVAAAPIAYAPPPATTKALGDWSKAVVEKGPVNIQVQP